MKNIVALAALLAAAPASAESLNISMQGICDGQDAPQNNPSQLVKFADYFQAPVNIVGIEVRVWPADGQLFDRNSYMLAGNADTPDVMALGDQWFDGTWRIETAWPAGYVFRFSRRHVDLHMSCYPVGIHWTARYIVHYVPAPL